MRKRKSLMFLLSAAMFANTAPVMTVAAAETEPAAETVVTVSQVLADESPEGRRFPLGSDISVEDDNGTLYLKGKMALGDKDTYADLLHGANSYTVAVEYQPTGSDEYNMILATGDHNMTLREYDYANGNRVLQFVIYAEDANGTGDWVTLNKDITDSNYASSRHTIVAGYNAETNQIFAYIDDSEVTTEDVPSGRTPKASEYAMWLGACPETGRGNANHKFYGVALFAGAKTPSDVEALTPADSALYVTAEDVRDVTVDLSMLQVAVNGSKDADLSLYLEEGKAEFSSALAAAQALIADPTTQAAIDDAAHALNSAWMNLRLIPNAAALEA